MTVKQATGSGLVMSPRRNAGVSPIPTSGLDLWLKADAINCTVDNTVIPFWIDSSNPELSIDKTDPAFAGGSPTYQTNEINGLPAIDFNGSNQNFSSQSDAASTLQTMFAVFCADVLTGYQAILGSTNTAGMELQIEVTTGKIAMVKQDVQQILLSSNAISTGTWNYVSARYNQTTDAVKIRVNGTETTGTYGNTLNTGPFGTYIGRQASGEYFNGRIAEVIRYSTALTDTEVVAVETYLKGKYAL